MFSLLLYDFLIFKNCVISQQLKNAGKRSFDRSRLSDMSHKSASTVTGTKEVESRSHSSMDTGQKSDEEDEMVSDSEDALLKEGLKLSH